MTNAVLYPLEVKEELSKEYIESGLFNSSGKPRLQCAKSHFERLDLSSVDTQEELIQFYEYWRDTKEYFVLFDPNNESYNAFKCSKRGNDVFRSRVKKRFSFLSTLENVLISESKNRSQKFHKTRSIFCTLTFNPALCDVKEAWEDRVGKEYNRWITNLRNKFGRIEAIRTFEAYGNGYPHVHVELLFQDKEFSTFKDTKGVWRIQEKEVFENSWKSFVDVQATTDLKGGLWYVSKHIIKNERADRPDNQEELWKFLLTLSMTWIYRKRSFAISGGFLDLMNILRNSNSRTLFQATLEGDLIPAEKKWIFLGVYTAFELGISGLAWSFVLDKSRYREQFCNSYDGGFVRLVLNES